MQHQPQVSPSTSHIYTFNISHILLTNTEPKHVHHNLTMAASLPVHVGSTHRPHLVLFPFMSKGHTIPLLHLARILVNRGSVVTVFTTNGNRPFIEQFLERCPDGLVSIIDLRFPSGVEGVPHGVESTDKLPTISLFRQFAVATKLMQPQFEESLSKLSNVTCIISDGFLSWTLASANKFGIPRLSFYGMNAYASAVFHDVGPKLSGPESDNELIHGTSFPWIKVTRNDFDEPLNQRDPSGPFMDFIIETGRATGNSYGLIMNTFYELEPVFIDYLNHNTKPKPWCVGPLCLAAPPAVTTDQKPKWISWLDKKLANRTPVLYVAFGSQAEISTQQMEAISKGLEQSKVCFLWVVRKCDTTRDLDELEARVGDRGMIVKQWVNQMEILNHESVQGFVSHCGWNSVLESICSGVPILAWPVMAEQPLNARMVVEEIKVGLRVETCDGCVKGFVKAEGLKKMIKELMEGEKGKEVRKTVKAVGAAAKAAVADGGSSWRTLNELINKLQRARNGGERDRRDRYV